MSEHGPIRVLHVVGAMNRGGVETWLMHVLRHGDRARFHHEFVVHSTTPGAYDNEIRALGSSVFPVSSPRNPALYSLRLRRHLRRHGPYDVVHSHVHHFSGVVLRAASVTGIRVRIAHSHNDTSAIQAKAAVGRRIYLKVTEALIRRYGTMRLAASEKAGNALFRWNHAAECPWRVLHCGIDLEPFRTLPDRACVRRELGIPHDDLVFGHVGNLHAQKNHGLLIRIFAELAHRHPQSFLLLIGVGPLRTELEAQVAALGLTSKVSFAGTRPDIARLLMGAIDVFVFPSLAEGLPLAVIEAQAAGLPIVLSDRVSEEADVMPELIRRVSPDAGPEEWANACIRFKDVRMPREGHQSVEASDMNIRHSVASLQDVYELSARERRPLGRRAA